MQRSVVFPMRRGSAANSASLYLGGELRVGQTEPHERPFRSRCKYRHLAPWCKFTLPSEAEVERRIIAITGVAFKYDDSYIWHAFVTEAFETLVKLDEVPTTATSFLPPREKRPARALLM